MNGSHHQIQQVLGRVRRDEFIGHDEQLRQLLEVATAEQRRGLLILSPPLAGASELLRQAFDELFRRRGAIAPIYFALPQNDATSVSVAIEFLNTFLLQYISFHRAEPSLARLSLTLNELVQLAPASDLDWIEDLVEDYQRQRFADDGRELVRLCLSAPRRIPRGSGRAFIIFDVTSTSATGDSEFGMDVEIVRALTLSGQPFALAGLRRELLTVIDRAGCNNEDLDRIDLEYLSDEESRQLLVSSARCLNVVLNDETADLLVQQLEGSPFFLASMLKAAQEKRVSLDSYLACERLYVDELLGGRLNRYFNSVLEVIAPESTTRRTTIGLLCEALPAGNRTTSLDSWSRRLGTNTMEITEIVSQLHAQELINLDGQIIDAQGSLSAWRDYLRSRFRLDTLREPRALVVADVMAGAIKRAPQTIARHFRRVANLRLRDLLERFNHQPVPRQLFDYEQFARRHKGEAPHQIVAALDSNADLFRLPQVFHAAGAASYSREFREFGEDASVVAHAFDGLGYTDSNEVTWLVAKIDHKLEVDLDLAKAWVERLERLALNAALVRTQVWLISNEGFSSEASQFLRDRGGLTSSQQQLELLAERLGSIGGSLIPASSTDEIELVLPMGGDYELLAANTAEQIARRLNFRPEAINQIKTAIVEACINASEHSLSPDRKIYQRFQVENDKLVITISSRGVVPAILDAPTEQSQVIEDAAVQRRGWGLKLIKTLMDEVEFERVDEGSRLRMAKYLRHSSG